MPPSSKVSIGAALLGDVKLAEGFSAAQEQMPEAWLSLLAQQHPDILPELLASCESGRELALQTAASLRLSIDCCAAPDKATSVWLRRLDGMRQALATRGRQKTSLSIQCKELFPGALEDEPLKRLGAVPAYLGGWISYGLTELQVRASYYYDDIGPPLDRLLAQCPYLTTLHLTTPAFTLPPPSTLPHLRELSVEQDTEDPLFGCRVADAENQAQLQSCRSISKYMPQLTTLTIGYCEHWDVIFSAANPAMNLTRFSTDMIYDELLPALIEHAPALKQVGAAVLDVDQSYRDKEWGVTELSVDVCPPGQEYHLSFLLESISPFLSRLANLPRPAAGPLTIKGRKESHFLLHNLWKQVSVAGKLAFACIPLAHTSRLFLDRYAAPRDAISTY